MADAPPRTSADRPDAVPARVRVSTEVHPTEDPAKVERCVRNLFPDAACRLEGVEDEGVGADGLDPGDAGPGRSGRMVCEAGDLARLRDLIADQKIQDTARTLLRHGLGARRLTFELSKQAAFAGAVNFSVERAPLGDLLVEVEAEPERGGPASPEALVEAVAPASTRYVPRAKRKDGAEGDGEGDAGGGGDEARGADGDGPDGGG